MIIIFQFTQPKIESDMIFLKTWRNKIINRN